MNICILSREFPPGVGGAETYAYELADVLGSRGHSVDVFTQWVESPKESINIDDNVEIHRISKSRPNLSVFSTLYFSYKARKQIDFTEYDIIHGMLMPPSTICVSIFNDIKIPVVLTSHGTSLDEAYSVQLETIGDYALKFVFHPINVILDKIAGEEADAIIAISNHANKNLNEIYGFDSKKLKLIPHGVDTDQYTPQIGTHPDVTQSKISILYVGRLGTRKGIDLALKAISIVDNPNIEFLIAGKGRYEDKLRELTRELGISNQIKFLGYVPEKELPELYSSSDIFILPSRYEGFGLVLLESMACGTPVIGSKAGGIPTAVDEGETGLTVERDPIKFAEAIEKLVSNTELRHSMGEAAVRKAKRNSWSNIIESVEQLYQYLSE